MPFNINNFTETMRFGGTRPHLFEVRLVLPPNLLTQGKGAFLKDFPLKATATQIPSSTVEAIPVFYQGRAVNFSGNRSYAPWTVQIINDEDFSIYDSFIGWLSALNDPIENVRNNGFTSRPDQYKSQATIIQYGQDETVIKSWECRGIFPINVTEITLAWQETNQIQQFQVTFAVDAVVPSLTTRSSVV